MPGPTDPNDPSNLIDNVGNSVDQVNTSLDKMKDLLKPIYDTLNNIFSTDTMNKINSAQKSFDALDRGFIDIKESIKNTYEQIDKFPTIDRSTGSFVGGIDRMTQKLVQFGSFISNARMFDDFSKNSMVSINDISNSVEGIQDAFKHIGFNVNLDKAFIQNAAQAEKLEATYLSLAGQSGNLDSIFKGQGNTLQDVGAIGGEYARKIGLVAEANGQSVKNALSFSAAMDKIPGSMNQTIKLNDSASGSLSKLDAAFKVVMGSGRSEADVMGVLSNAYENLSTSQGKIVDSTQKGLEMFALMSEVSSTLKIDFNDVRNTMEDISKTFKFVGNETDASARILGRYTTALRETGLTARASMDIIKGMTDSISKMEMGTKAFLSLRSGGPGGLQGAFKVEQMLRDGKLDQVMQMAERNLKQQFGGRIVSLQDAARDPNAAAQFQRQRSMLQSGAFGIGKGLDDAGATRLLEAMGKGNLGGNKEELERLVSGQDAMNKVADRGSQWNERQFNEIKRAAIASERTAIAMELQAGLELKRITGSLRGADTRAETRQQMSQAGLNANIAGEKSDMLLKGGASEQDLAESIIMSFRQATKSLFNSVEGGMSGATQALSNIAKGSINDVADLVEESDHTRRSPKTNIANQAMQNGVRDRMQQTVRQSANQNARDTVAALSQDKKLMEPQKIVLEIISDGNNVKIISKPDNISVNNSSLSRSNSTANPMSDSGY